MSVFKLARCSSCGYNRRESKPGKSLPTCPRCDKEMNYSSNWYISYTFESKKHVQSIAPQKKISQDALNKIKTQIVEKKFFHKPPSVYWNEATEQFRRWYITNTKHGTRRMYDYGLSVLNPYFENYTLDKITPAMVEQFKEEKSKHVKPATVNRYLATIKRLFSLAEEWNLVESNKIRKVKLLKEENARTRFLTDEEISRLLSECRTPYMKLAVLIALNTGLRKDGVLTLEWTEIDFKSKVIHKTVKGGIMVHIPLTQVLEKALLDYKSEQKILCPYVISSPFHHERPITDIKKGFRAACKRAMITDFTFHDLRHTFASKFLTRVKGSKSLKALQEILGHKSLKMTMRYAHLLDQHMKEAMNEFKGIG